MRAKSLRLHGSTLLWLMLGTAGGARNSDSASAPSRSPCPNQHALDSVQVIRSAARAVDSSGFYVYKVIRFERVRDGYRVTIIPDPKKYPALRGGGALVHVSRAGIANVLDRGK